MPLLKLAKGTIEGRTGPGILDCVRKFTFKPDPCQVRAVHSGVWCRFQEDRGEEYGGTAEIKEQGAEIFKLIQHTVALNFKAMRSLETLVWDCNFPLNKDTWLLLACSTAHNLLINDTLIAESFSLGPSLTPPSWPLRSLVLMNVRLVGSSGQENSQRGVPLRPNPTHGFFKSLFQLCSQTLESLTWESWHPEALEPLSLGTDSRSFPKLRKLRIRLGLDVMDRPSFASFLSAPFKSLELRHSSFRLFEDDIRSHVEEPYRDLEELVVKFTDNLQLITQLILKHNGLKKLWVAQSYDMSGRDNSFDRVLIPGFGKGHFNNLRSLYIQWGGQNEDAGHGKDHFDIPPESLAAICELTTLEQLGLRRDEMIPEYTSFEDYIDDTYAFWPIGHGKLQAHLQSLKNLRMLVIR
jgi:hypothetical protein